jgi:hypothetical protein
MRRLAGSRDGLDRRGRLWGAPTGQGAGAFLKMGALPAQSRGLLAPYDHQTRSRSNASRCIRCGHGGGSLGGCMGEYRRARGSLHVRGPLWLRSQVPIRRPKGHSFTQDEDILYNIPSYIVSLCSKPLLCLWPPRACRLLMNTCVPEIVLEWAQSCATLVKIHSVDRSINLIPVHQPIFPRLHVIMVAIIRALAVVTCLSAQHRPQHTLLSFRHNLYECPG